MRLLYVRKFKTCGMTLLEATRGFVGFPSHPPPPSFSFKIEQSNHRVFEAHASTLHTVFPTKGFF